MRMKTTALIAILSALFLTVLWACESTDPASNPSGSDGDSDGDGDGDSDGDGDGDSDGDGDGDADTWDPDANCDCPDLAGDSSENFGKAMNICPGLGFINSVNAWSSDSAGTTVGMEVLDHQGSNSCMVAQHGCEMFAMSTGLVGQSDPNSAEGMGGGLLGTANAADPAPQYQGDTYTGGGSGEPICDVNQLQLSLTAPAGAEGFSFDFLFASAEYDEWVGEGYNDTFYAILEHSNVNGGATTNISFDSNSNEIEVDTNFFENSSFPCDETGSGWEPAMASVSGSTGWLRTSYPVSAGDAFSLTFSIHDEGDCVFDSIVFLDNFQWSGEPVVNDTVPIE